MQMVATIMLLGSTRSWFLAVKTPPKIPKPALLQAKRRTGAAEKVIPDVAVLLSFTN